MNLHQILSTPDNVPHSVAPATQGQMFKEGNTPGGKTPELSPIIDEEDNRSVLDNHLARLHTRRKGLEEPPLKQHKYKSAEDAKASKGYFSKKQIADLQEKLDQKSRGTNTMASLKDLINETKVEATMQPSPVQVPPEMLFPIGADRRAVILRLLRATGIKEAMECRLGINVSRSWHPLQIKQRTYNDHDYRINAPYGMIGLAINADPDELREMIAFCQRKKLEYTRLGDWDTGRLYGNRQAMIAGILNGLTQFKLL